MFENKGEGLLQACISSLYTKVSPPPRNFFSKGKANQIGSEWLIVSEPRYLIVSGGRGGGGGWILNGPSYV